MNISELAEQMRGEMLRGPNPELAAVGARERRWTNSRVYEIEIARHNELIATIAKNNLALTALGDPAIDIEAVDPLDLNRRAWDERIAALGRVIWQQTDRRDYLRACEEATKRDLLIANETPIERRDREMAELRAENHALKSRVDQIEARRSESQPRERYIPPARPLPVMSGCSVPMGDSLSPGYVLPPSPGVAVGAAAQIVGMAGRTDNRPAISNGRLERLATDVSTPSDFLRAIAR